MRTLTAAAAEYLNLGLPVIALTGKTPNVSIHRTGLTNPIVGKVETDDDEELLARVFLHPDTTGVGIVIPFPYVVVDIDGEAGAVQFRDEYKPDAAHDLTWAAKTGRGMHLWYACSTPTGSIKLGPNLDLKGQKSYVAAPPSRHPDGHVYEWLSAPDEGYVLSAPPALERRIEDHAYDIRMAQEKKDTFRRSWGPKYEPGDTKFYAQASHDALIDGMKTAADGNRNNYLHWAAATLAEEGGSEHEFELLAEAALAVGLHPIEVKRTVRSARRASV